MSICEFGFLKLNLFFCLPTYIEYRNLVLILYINKERGK
jgi:hypothetical protein